MPKIEGGLGFRDSKSWNSALLSKVLWNIHNKKDTLWVRWIDQVYLRGTCIWEISPLKDHSPLFKKLIEIRNLFKQAFTQGHSNLPILEAADQFFSKSMVSNDGDFCVTKAYDFFRPKGNFRCWANEVWKHYITPKHSFTLWLGVLGKLLTKDNLLYLDITRDCILCSLHEETCLHLFFDCPFSARVWNSIKDWLGITRAMTTLASALKWMKKEARGTTWHSKAKRIALASTVYYIWMARNRMIFENLRPHVESIVRRIKTHIYKVIFSLYPHVSTQYETMAIDS